jgi:hypothetical protein
MDTTTLDDRSGNGAAPQARTVGADRGLGWWTDAWALFTQSALLWVALALILIVGLGVIGLVPVLGALAIGLLSPVLLGSWMLAARKVEGGGALEVADLFVGFQGERLTPLLVLGALLLGALVVIGVVAGVLGAGAVFGMVMGGASRSAGGMMAAMGVGFMVLAVCLVLGVLVSMALWFAPALVVFRNVPPMEAVKLSIAATLKNWLPFLVFSVLYVVASVVASIPFGLGWLVLAPVAMLAVYVSYRDAFEQPA